jgi:hypothetical protein
MRICEQTFNGYPKDAQSQLLTIRQVILDLAAELSIEPVSESLKWGEVSFSVSTGSPIRIDWEANTPEVCYIFFNCQTKLVETFRELYANQLDFAGNRAILLSVSSPLPIGIIKHCLSLALTYKKVKHLPLLGA